MDLFAFFNTMRLETALTLIFLVAAATEYITGKLQKIPVHRLRESVNNLLIGGISLSVIALFTLLNIPLLRFLYDHCRLFENGKMDTAKFLLLFVLIDFTEYWFHRLSHEVNLFWSVHVVHHQGTHFNLSVGLRTSLFVPLLNIFFYLPFPLLGFTPEYILLVVMIQGFYQLLIHTVIIPRLGFLEWFLVTPSAHRVHHGKNEKYLDRNYGKVLLVWDRLFRTYCEETEPVEYGITRPLERDSPLHSIMEPLRLVFVQVSGQKKRKEKLRALFGKPGTVENSSAVKRELAQQEE